MANSLYTKGKEALLSAGFNLSTDTIKAVLLSNGYTPNLATDQYLSTVATYRVTGTTDQTLGTKAITSGIFDAADVTWTAVAGGATGSYVAIYKDTGNAATSPLLALFDTITNFPVTTNGGDITVQWDNGANKIFAL